MSQTRMWRRGKLVDWRALTEEETLMTKGNPAVYCCGFHQQVGDMSKPAQCNFCGAEVYNPIRHEAEPVMRLKERNSV